MDICPAYYFAILLDSVKINGPLVGPEFVIAHW